MNIETSVDSLRKVSCRFNYRITRHDPEQSRPKLLVKGYTIHAAINGDGKLVKLPEEIVAKLDMLVKTSQ